MFYKLIFCCLLLAGCIARLAAQIKPVWSELPALPDREGFAGMMGGVINDELFCMGGANFPDKKPWEGGSKKWYHNIYRLEGSAWRLLKDTLYTPLAYGVSVTYKNNIIIAGGSSGNTHLSKVVAYSWNGKSFTMIAYPDLPLAVSNMSGTLLGDLLLIAGGNREPGGPALQKFFALDLTDIKKGWVELEAWPGAGRIMPACAAVDGKFYLFSGETVGVSARAEKYRLILQDAFSFTPVKADGRWGGSWKTLAPMPKGATAAGLPLPVLNGKLLLWGGVDAVTSAYRDPATHPGNMREILLYDPGTDTWQYTGRQENIAARVTLPVIYWKGGWVFISGEVRPGVRTNSVYSVR